MSDMPDAAKATRLRQALLRSEQERQHHLRDLLAERGPVIRGSFVRQLARCGKPSCKCARGEPHSSAAFYVRIDGVRRCFYVPLEERDRVERLNRGQQKLRSARLALANLGTGSVEFAEQLEAALAEPYPAPITSTRSSWGGTTRGGRS